MADEKKQTLDDMLDAADARTLNMAGNAFSDRGMWNEALECYERSRELRQREGDRAGEALVLNNLGATYYAMGDWDAALTHYQEALAMLRSIAADQTLLPTLMNICFLQYAQGGRPGPLLDEAEQLATRLGQEEPLTKIYWMRGDTAFQEGKDLPAAFAFYAQACLHAARAGQELLDATARYAEEHMTHLAGHGQRLAALAFCDHLLAFGRANNLGDAFASRLEKKRQTLLAPPLLG